MSTTANAPSPSFETTTFLICRLLCTRVWVSNARWCVGWPWRAVKRLPLTDRDQYTRAQLLRGYAMLAPNTARSRGIKGYRDLVVWQRAMDLVTATYRLTASFPRHETYGLV